MKKYLRKQISNLAVMLIEQVKENFVYEKSLYFTKIKLSNNLKEGKIVNYVIMDLNENILMLK